MRASPELLELGALGALVGAVAGTVGALGFAILHLTAKRLRNAALVRRGEPPYKDLVFAPGAFVLLLGGLGLSAGGVTAALVGAWWPVAALAGAAPPAIVCAVALVGTAAQAR